ncbi:MAG TPA: response regulator [Terriglobales bacterium]|nr:response regulator [Terriglobales bacterium]
MKLRTMIVDDEPLARERLRTLLGQDAECEIVAECDSGSQAIALIREHRPDLVFLDVQMPNVDGFGVLAGLEPEHLPHVIFVTAFDRFALRAFENHALDYLLKPFDEPRFHRALQHAKRWIRSHPEGENGRVAGLLRAVNEGHKYLERIVIKNRGRISFVPTESIDYIQAAGNYAELRVANESHLLRRTMQALEAELDPEKFVRIHRSTIVNLSRIKELQSSSGGDYVVVMNGGARLTLSRSFRDRLSGVLGMDT